MEVCKIIKKTEDIEFIGATLISIEEYKKVAGIVPLTEDWWLRSPVCNHNDYALSVFDTGNEYWERVNRLRGVRPALIFDLATCTFAVGDKFEVNGITFTVISNNMMLADKCVEKRAFRSNFRVSDANDYAVSNVKKFVDEWYEKFVKNSTQER